MFNKNYLFVAVCILALLVGSIGVIANGYDHPKLIDHVHHLQTLVDVDPSFKERVRNCGNYTKWRPHFDTVEVEGKDTNFGFGLLCDDGSYIGTFVVDSEYPTYYHYSKEETLLVPIMS